MKWPPAIGTRVVINEEGHRRYAGNKNNPRGVEGTITQSEHHCYVKWDNGDTNSYREGTLDLVIYQLEND